MLIKPGDTLDIPIDGHGTSGASLLTTGLARLIHNGTVDTAVAVTITHLTDAAFGGTASGVYNAHFTVPGGYGATSNVALAVPATNGAGVFDTAVVWRERLNSFGFNDLTAPYGGLMQSTIPFNSDVEGPVQLSDVMQLIFDSFDGGGQGVKIAPGQELPPVRLRASELVRLQTAAQLSAATTTPFSVIIGPNGYDGLPHFAGNASSAARLLISPAVHRVYGDSITEHAQLDMVAFWPCPMSGYFFRGGFFGAINSSSVATNSTGGLGASGLMSVANYSPFVTREIVTSSLPMQASGAGVAFDTRLCDGTGLSLTTATSRALYTNDGYDWLSPPDLFSGGSAPGVEVRALFHLDTTHQPIGTTATGHVTAVGGSNAFGGTGNNIFATSATSSADGYYAATGTLQFTSGANSGQSYGIAAYAASGGLFTLASTPAQTVSVNDNFTLTGGLIRAYGYRGDTIAILGADQYRNLAADATNTTVVNQGTNGIDFAHTFAIVAPAPTVDLELAVQGIGGGTNTAGSRLALHGMDVVNTTRPGKHWIFSSTGGWNVNNYLDPTVIAPSATNVSSLLPRADFAFIIATQNGNMSVSNYQAMRAMAKSENPAAVVVWVPTYDTYNPPVDGPTDSKLANCQNMWTVASANIAAGDLFFNGHATGTDQSLARWGVVTGYATGADWIHPTVPTGQYWWVVTMIRRMHELAIGAMMPSATVIAAAVATNGGGVNIGNVLVTSDTSGPNGATSSGNLAVKSGMGTATTGVGNAIVQAYLLSEFIANPNSAAVRGLATTTDTGAWSHMMLNSGLTYVFVARDSSGGFFGTNSVTL